jgi:phenylpyruvate tautomerase PptA (4-oxalocrotonate tautomerase family)
MSIYVAIEFMAREFWAHGWRSGSEYEMAEIHLTIKEQQ